MTRVDFLACRGMAVLIETHQRLPSSVRLVVVADGAATSRVMTLIGLTDFITIRATLDATLKDLNTADDGRHPQK
jgi:anti-anti-sigma factor